MSFERYRDLFNVTRRIPLHYQKRYFANISNESFNASHVTGIYKKKIKALLKNNRLLAIALQNDRSKKEELLEENKSNANIIMFSRLKLSTLSDNLKQIVTVLDETLAMIEMHSSVTSSKLTPKNTLGREEFKEQVKEVLMDSIPEEPESPQKISNQEVTHQNKKLCEPQHMNHPPSKQLKSYRKTSKRSTVNEKSVKEGKKIDMGTSNYEHSQPISSLKNYEECSPAKLGKRSSKNRTFTSEVCGKKKSTKPTTNKRSSKASKNVVWDKVKREGSLSKDRKIEESDCLSNSHQSRLHNDNEVQKKSENNVNANNENEDDILCTLKDSFSSYDVYSPSDCEKENKNSKRKISAKRFKSSGDVELGPTVSKKNYSRNSALKNLSSRFNIEKSERGEEKDEACEVDDLITTKQKCAELMLSIKRPKTCDVSDIYSKREMVKNLATNTYLATEEVHKFSNPLEVGKMNIQKTDCFVSKQPVVLLKDIFQSGKSFCRSIPGRSCDKFNETSLDLELFGHCSLKVIPEESIRSEDNSIDQTEEKDGKSKLHNAKPLFSIEDNVMEQCSNEEKRTFRKRTSTINYKEQSVNVKLRR